MERLKITGIVYNNEQVKFGLGPSGKTALIDFGDNVLIFRPIEGKIGTASRRTIKMNPSREIKRRIDAYNIYQHYLPKYTPYTSHVILQGRGGENPQEERNIPVLGRFIKKLGNVNPITEISDDRIMENLILCQALYEINRQFLRILMEKGIITDTGRGKNFGKDRFGPLSGITRKLTHDNIMIGYEKDGEEKIFIDPDWYVYPGEDGQNPHLQIVKRAAILIARMAFFKTLILFNKLVTSIKNAET